MMRSVIFLVAMCLAGAEQQGDCALDGARAVDDLLDSATYIWASVQRCGGNAAQKNTILCTLDISSAIESVNAMVNVILKAVEKCGHMEAEGHKCGLAVGVLTRSFAGLAAGSAGITAKCPNALNNNNPLVPLVSWTTTAVGAGALADAQQSANAATGQASFAQCLVDVKDLTKSLFKAIKRIMTIKESCADGAHHCAHNSLKLTASLAAMGEFLAGTVGRCSASTPANEKMIIESECAEKSMQLIRHVSNMGRASVAMMEQCNVGAARLYQLENGDIAETQNSSFVTLALAALLPLTAVLSFVGGSRFAKSRAQAQNFDSLAVEE